MKRRLVKAVSLAILAFMLLVTNITGAYAAQGEGAGSTGTFEFMAGDQIGTTKPVDPELPEYPIDPDTDENGNTGETGNTGELRIDYVSDFRFGSQRIKKEAQQLHAELINAGAGHTESGRITVPNFVQVSDYRGIGAGWTLSVKQDDDFKVVGGEYDGRALSGAQIILSNISANTNDASGAVEIPQRTLTLNQGEQDIMVAEPESGFGTHVAHFGEYKQGSRDSALQSVTLDIPGNIVKMQADYETTLTWTLSTVPGNEGDGDDGDDEDYEDGEEEEEIKEDIDDTDEGEEIEIADSMWILLDKNEETRTAELLYKGDIGQRIYDSRGAVEWKDSELREWLRTDYRDSLGAMSNLIVKVEKEAALLGQLKSTPLETNIETVYLLSFEEYKTYSDKFILHADSASNYSYYLRGAFSNGSGASTYSENTLSSVIISFNMLIELGTYPYNTGIIRPAVTVRY